MVGLGDEYKKYMISEIEDHRGENSEVRNQLECLFGSYDELMECALHFYRMMVSRGVVCSLALKKLRRMGVDVDKLSSNIHINIVSSNEDRADYQILKNQRERVKNGLKIAYKSNASVEKCVELYTKYQNIDRVAEELQVSSMTVCRRLKEAGL